MQSESKSGVNGSSVREYVILDDSEIYLITIGPFEMLQRVERLLDKLKPALCHMDNHRR